MLTRRALRQTVSAFLSRGYASGAGSSAPGLLEIREYTMKPEGLGQGLKITAEYVDVRRELLPFLGMFTADVGSCLHRVTHMYAYDSLEQRDQVRGRAQRDPRWKKFVELSRPHMQYQENKVLVEATPIYQALSLPPTSQFTPPPKQGGSKVVYELRSYQLAPGYTSVPRLVDLFAEGLPAKVAADPEGRLVFFGHTEVGMLNNVVEIWRYPSAQACIQARQAARQVPKWRDTIAAVAPGVQHFSSAFLNPVPFSPWQ